jgi:hypothetical protein
MVLAGTLDKKEYKFYSLNMQEQMFNLRFLAGPAGRCPAIPATGAGGGR